jgi:hypothetical protein
MWPPSDGENRDQFLEADEVVGIASTERYVDRACDSGDQEVDRSGTLVAPLGQTITTGTRAVEWPVRSGVWALSVGQSCAATGSVTVHAVTFTGDEVTELVMDFTLLCDYGETDRPFRGWVVYDPGTEPGSLDGSVVKDGAGVANATVDLFTMDGASPVATATTDSNGDFVIGGLAPGAYAVRFSGAGIGTQWRGGEVARFSSRGVAITSARVTTASFQMSDVEGVWGYIRPEVPIRGGAAKLYDEAGRLVLTGFSFRIFPVWDPERGVGWGYLIDVDALQPGRYKIGIEPYADLGEPPSAPGYHPDATTIGQATVIRLDAAKTRQADVELGQAGTIVVTVQYASSPNLSFPWSWVIDASDGSVISGNLTGATGTFIVSPGTYFAMGANFLDEREQLWDFFPELYEAAPANRLDLATPISIAPGQTRSVSVTLDPFFPDMFDSVFLSDIFWMQTVGITSGCGAAGYCPDDPVTRGQMAAFLARALQLPAASGIDFVDDDTSMFETDIERLASRGITLGCNPPANDRFCPDQEVTRGQMAAFLVRAMGYTDSAVDFEDVGGSVFAADIRRLATAGVTVGCNPPENDRFCPNEPVSRGQMAAFLHRALGGGVLYPGSADGPLLRPLQD